MPEATSSSYREVFIGLRQHDLKVRAFIPTESGDQIPILWMHGFLQSAESWQSLWNDPLICNKTWSCFVDLPGHGFSDWNTCSNQQVFQSIMHDTVESCVDFLLAETGTHPILIGWSYAGYFIGEYLRNNPNAAVRHVFGVNGAFLLNSAFKYIGPDFLKYSLGFVNEDPLLRDRADQGFFQAIWLEKGTDGIVGVPEPLTNPPPNHAGRVSLQARRTYLSLREDYSEDLLNATIPITLIATRDDSVIRFRMSQNLARKKPQLSLIELDSGGHGFFYRKPDLLLDLLRQQTTLSL